MSEKREEKSNFYVDLVGFSSFSVAADVALTVNPEYDIKAVVSSLVHKDGLRLITLVLKRVKPEVGRRGYSLKQEWEQMPIKEVLRNE